MSREAAGAQMAMTLPNNKTKIVATIGPASNSPEMLESLIRSGINIARLNLSHGIFDEHAEIVTRIHTASKTIGLRIMRFVLL
jgi:pyruvate kinase